MDNLLSGQIVVGVAALLGIAALLLAMGRIKQSLLGNIPADVEQLRREHQLLQQRVAQLEAVDNNVLGSVQELKSMLRDGQAKSTAAHEKLADSIALLREDMHRALASTKQYESDKRQTIYDRLNKLEGK